ncbi:glycosyltransferase family 4 protein [Patescibacteria group bacterium]|nr:glycosyltransferase family 4 protein [Patescibacteria group bacterium]
MIIGIDVREGARVERAGKGEYVYQVVSELVQHSEHRFVLFSDRDVPKQWQKDNVRTVIFKTPSFIWQFLVFLQLEFIRPVDTYFSTTSLIIPALVRSTPVVTTLFDFVSFLFPSRHQQKAVVLEKMWMKLAIRYSQHLLSISEHTKKDAIKLFKVSPDKITTTYLAASFVQEQESITINKENVILFIGTLEPRKNIVKLVEAFNKLKTEGIHASLLLVGKWGWQSDTIKQAIEQSPFKQDIQVLGYVRAAQKQSLYKQSAVLAFPSIYEGFGLPPLEAMAMGVPVVTSNISSLPEVVGDAAVLVDPNSTEEIYSAVKKILTDKSFTEQLVAKGYIQAQKFNWQKTADATLGVLLGKN